MKLSYILFSARIVVTFQNNLKKRVLKDDFRLIGLLILETIPVAILSVFQKTSELSWSLQLSLLELF